MSAASGGSVEKAWFQSADTWDWFDVQYNPTNFKFTKPVSWKEHDDQGKEASLEYQKNSPATMSCELIFDTTIDGNDVRQVWVNKLLEFTNPEVPGTKGEAGSLDKLRPHKVYFTWGSYDFLGVFESVDVSYLMFSEDGTPLRAKVAVKMKEWVPEAGYSASGSGTTYNSTPVKMVTVGPGETISAVAAKFGTTAQAICDANNIDDATADHTGAQLVVPKG